MKQKVDSHLLKLFRLHKLAQTGISLLSACLLFTACGYDKADTIVEESLGFSQQALSGGTPLDDNAMAVALRICYAYRTKRSKFTVEMLKGQFNFSMTTRNCQNQETTESFTSELTQESSGEPLYFESDYSKNYFKEVQTDLHGYLATICGDVLAGETPLNTAEIGNEFYEYTFQSSVSGGDQVAIQIGAQDTPSAANPSVKRKIVFEVLTNATSAGNYQGMVVETRQYSPCGDAANTVRLVKQVFNAP
jgi:hypothetical protein